MKTTFLLLIVSILSVQPLIGYNSLYKKAQKECDSAFCVARATFGDECFICERDCKENEETNCDGGIFKATCECIPKVQKDLGTNEPTPAMPSKEQIRVLNIFSGHLLNYGIIETNTLSQLAFSMVMAIEDEDWETFRFFEGEYIKLFSKVPEEIKSEIQNWIKKNYNSSDLTKN